MREVNRVMSLSELCYVPKTRTFIHLDIRSACVYVYMTLRLATQLMKKCRNCAEFNLVIGINWSYEILESTLWWLKSSLNNDTMARTRLRIVLYFVNWWIPNVLTVGKLSVRFCVKLNCRNVSDPRNKSIWINFLNVLHFLALLDCDTNCS